MERLIDTAAREMGIDRLELRRRNHVRPQEIPYKAASGMTYDSGDFGKVFEKALQAGDVITVPISQAIANVKTVPANGQLVRTARDTGISFGAPDEAQHHRPNSKSGEQVPVCG